MAITDDTLEKLATEAATRTVAEAVKALERDSAAAALKAVRSLSVSSDIEEMQRRLKSIEAVPNLAVGLRDLESPVLKVAREFALSQSHFTEAARSAVHLEAVRMSELRASVASRFVEKFAAVETFGIAKQFSEMQAMLGQNVSAKLLEASRSVADQWSTALKQSQQLLKDQMTAISQSTQVEFSKLAALQSPLDREVFKNLSAGSSLSKDLFKPLAGLDGALRGSLSERFKETSATLDNTFKASAAHAALAFSKTLPQFDRRIAEAMREFNALGNLKAGAATISGFGTVESGGPGAAVSEGRAAHAEPAAPSSVELWWAKQPIQVKAFFLVLLFILQSASEEFIHERVKEWTGTHSPQERQVVYDHITQNFGADTAKRLRCIRASALNVRSEANATGKVLDSLLRGTPVEVLESQGSWSRIRYRMPGASHIREGWAASGYLSLEIC